MLSMYNPVNRPMDEQGVCPGSSYSSDDPGNDRRTTKVIKVVLGIDPVGRRAGGASKGRTSTSSRNQSR